MAVRARVSGWCVRGNREWGRNVTGRERRGEISCLKSYFLLAIHILFVLCSFKDKEKKCLI